MNEKPAAVRVALIQDLSGVGRCALTIAIPVLAAMNAQPCPLPTAVFSANTAFPQIEHEDLSAFLSRATAHWTRERMRFRALASGYLSNAKQAVTVERLARNLREDADFIQLTDPAMADHGRLYRGLADDMPSAMRALCSHADVITPNVTEAAMLTGRDPADSPTDTESLARWLESLISLGCGCAIITGVPIGHGRMANACASRNGTGISLCAYEPLPATYHGTGDLFAAALTGKLVNGCAPEQAMAFASAFVYAAIERTLRLNTPAREGVQFEALLSKMDAIQPMPVTRA